MILLSIYKKNEEFLQVHPSYKMIRPIRAFRRRLNNYVISHYKSTYVEIEGRKMYLDPNDSLRLSLREYEKFTTEFVKQVIKKGDIVLDLGANIGYWTLLFAKLVGDQGQVYAFEPEPSNFKLVEKNVKENNFNNVIVEKKAVSNITGKSKMFLSYESTDHRIYDPKENREFIEIDTIRLDEYFKDKNLNISLVKSNVQGSDFAAIEGMSNLIDKFDNITIMTEFAPHMLEGFGSNPKEFLTKLQNRGFYLFDFRWMEKKIVSTSIKELMSQYAPEKVTGTLLLLSKDKSFSKKFNL